MFLERELAMPIPVRLFVALVYNNARESSESINTASRTLGNITFNASYAVEYQSPRAGL